MLKEIIAAVFRSRGKRRMRESEVIYTMSFDLNWFTHEESRKVVEVAKKTGLLEEEDGELKPAFDVDNIEITPGFKPDADLLPKSVVDEIISEISEKTGRKYQEVVSMINAEQERMRNLVSFEVAALIVAKRHGVDIGKYLEEVERSLYEIS